jgi:phenylpyruvate tautomerase PptA (4-oxalocrotonate tautomerase family)
VPIVEVAAFEQRFQDEQSNEGLIAALTDAVCAAFGEEVRDETWVVLNPVSRQHWGFGGKVRR